MNSYWFSAYDQIGNQFGTTIDAETEDDAISMFYKQYPDCDIADCGGVEEFKNFSF